MKNFGKLFVCVLFVACGGSSSHQSTAPVRSTAMAPTPAPDRERTESASMPKNDDSTLASTNYGAGSGSSSSSSSTTTSADTGMGMGAGSGSAAATGAGAGSGSSMTTPNDASPATAGTGSGTTAIGADQTVAKAELKSVKDGSSMGTITFTKTDSGQIQIEATFTNLGKDGVHALYIHENGDCSGKAKKVGKDLNPTHAKWGPPSSATRHAGDMGNVTADDSGTATFTMTTDSLTMEGDRPDSILNRAVVIHAKKDAKSGAGAAMACGVIEMQ